MATADLTWQLIRAQNSFMVKRNGIVLSREPGNLVNKHSYKYSGLANTKTIDVSPAEKGIVLSLKSEKNAHKPIKGASKTVLKKDVARVAKSVRAIIGNGQYRPDLARLAVARAAALIRAGRSKSVRKLNSRTKKARQLKQ